MLRICSLQNKQIEIPVCIQHFTECMNHILCNIFESKVIPLKCSADGEVSLIDLYYDYRFPSVFTFEQSEKCFRHFVKSPRDMFTVLYFTLKNMKTNVLYTVIPKAEMAKGYLEFSTFN